MYSLQKYIHYVSALKTHSFSYKKIDINHHLTDFHPPIKLLPGLKADPIVHPLGASDTDPPDVLEVDPVAGFEPEVNAPEVVMVKPLMEGLLALLQPVVVVEVLPDALGLLTVFWLFDCHNLLSSTLRFF
jgi:hypothetical protein